VSNETRDARRPSANANANAAPWTPRVRRYLLANLAFVVVTAYFSVTYFHPDEHFQILEFVGHKLGTTTAAELPWEFRAQMRSWLQPAAYFVLVRAAQTLGVHDIFTITFLLRLASGLLAWVAVGFVVRTTLRWSDDDAVRLAQLRATTLLGFLPYLAVRTSSENVSCSLVSFGFCVVVDALRSPGARSAAPLSPRAAFLAGILFGLAFEVRFHTALLAAGLFAWLCVFRRLRAPGMAGLVAGGAIAIAAGLLVDRWGYGAWCFPAYPYFRRNLIEHVASTQFGTDPVYGYLYLLPANIFAPVVVVLMVAVALTWMRRPKHPVTWVTLPYTLVNCLLAHKEERLFFPVLLIATSSITLGLSPAGRASALPAPLVGLARRADAAARHIWQLRRSRLATIAIADSVLGLLLLAVYPLGWCADVKFYEYVYRHVEPGARLWMHAGWGFPEYPFYRRTPWEPQPLGPAGDGPAVARPRPGPRGEADYFVTPLPYEVADPRDLGAQARLVYSELPGWRHPIVRAAIGPTFERVMRALFPGPGTPKAKWLTLYRLESAGADGTGRAAAGESP
jgi:GPI mannosyltransferase 3